jgi:hypothetical protein
MAMVWLGALKTPERPAFDHASVMLAAAHPDIVRKIESIMAAEHTPSPHYDAPEQSEKETKTQQKKQKAASLPESSFRNL